MPVNEQESAMPVVNRGTAPGDQNADTAYAAFGKVNDKFDAVDLVASQQATAIGTKADAAAVATALNGKQDVSAILTAIAGLSAAAGILEQTGAAVFTKRATGVGASTSLLTRADGDGRYSKALPGSVVQSALSRHVAFTSGTAALAGGNDTIPQITDGFSVFNAAAFTPISATNILRVTVLGQAIAGSAVFYWAGLFRDAVAGAKSAQLLGAAVGDTPSEIGIVFEEIAGSVSATTFRLRLGNMNGASATLAVNGATAGRRLGGSSGVTIRVEEIKV